MNGQATVQVATAIAQATQEAQRQAEREATRQAARTRDASLYEMQLIDKQIEGTSIALSAFTTMQASTAIVESVRKTETAQAQGTATAWPQTATPLSATQVAVILAVESEQRRAVTQPIANAAMVIAALIAATYVLRMFLEVIDRRFRVLETRSGTVAWVSSYDDLEPRLLAVNASSHRTQHYRAHAPTDAPVVKITASGSVLSSKPDNDGGARRRTVLELVEKAIVVAGEDASQFPSWRHLPGVTSEKYQRAMHILEELELVKVLPSVGSFVVGEGSLADLQYHLEMRMAQTLSPLR